MRARGVTLIVLTAVVLAAAALFAWWTLTRKPPEPIRIGVLHSLTGPLAVSERPLLDAYRLAVAEINAEGGVLGRPVELDIRDGESDPETFSREAERLLRTSDDHGAGVDVLAGCWSSATRKALLPVLEHRDAILLYPVQFEGLEESPHVVYLGVAPNQQVGPGLEWALSRGAKRVFLVGSDYVYPRAANTMARDMIEGRGATVVGEAYLPLSGGDPRPIAERIAAAKPDLILNTVNGEANQGLMKALRMVGIDPATTMILAFSIGEPEIRAWDPTLFKDVILVGSYFRGVGLDANRRFLGALRQSAGPDVIASDAMASAYTGLHLWADAVREVGSAEPRAVLRSLRGRHMAGPGGTVVIDPETQYVWLTVRLGRVRADGDVDVIWDSNSPVPPRPWPMWRSRREWEEIVDGFRNRWGGAWEAPPGRPSLAPADAPAAAPPRAPTAEETAP